MPGNPGKPISINAGLIEIAIGVWLIVFVVAIGWYVVTNVSVASPLMLALLPPAGWVLYDGWRRILRQVR